MILSVTAAVSLSSVASVIATASAIVKEGVVKPVDYTENCRCKAVCRTCKKVVITAAATAVVVVSRAYRVISASATVVVVSGAHGVVSASATVVVVSRADRAMVAAAASCVV